jgi:hypothetical protein
MRNQIKEGAEEMKRLNPRWLASAIVLGNDGSRFGTVAKVDGDALTVLRRGIVHIMSAKELDASGRIVKPNAISKKYIN